MAGWGDFFGKISQWFPSRDESLRNQREKLQKELDEITSKNVRLSLSDIKRITAITSKLHEIETKLINR